MSKLPISSESLSKLERLCRSSIEAGIAKLCEVGTWPRPSAARILRAGRDFYYGDLIEVEEVDKLVQHLASDDNIKSLYFEKSSISESWRLYWFWQRLFLYVLRETQGTMLNEMAFKEWFKKFVKELYSETAVWRSIDTVTGLNLRTKKFRLDGDVTVLTSTPGYRLEVLTGNQDLDFSGFWGQEPGGNDKATIVTTVKIPKKEYAGIGEPHSRLLKNIERSNTLIEAIRFTKTGAPRLHCHIMVHLSDFPLHEPHGYCVSEGAFGPFEEEAIIERGDFRKIKRLWQEIMKVRNNEPLSIGYRLNEMDAAIGRFFMSYKLQNVLDNITDLTIALESLFNPSGNEELKHRVAIRAAWLLSSDDNPDRNSGEVKNTIYDRVRTMYEMRSCRVHGRKPQESEIRNWFKTLTGIEYDKSKVYKLMPVAVESAREIVRRAIRACMELPKSGAEGPQFPFPPNFDENIVIAGQRRIWQKAAGIKKQR